MHLHLAHEITAPWSMLQPDGRSRAHWMLFQSDGAPHSLSAAARETGAAGSGAGAIYLHGADRDYAVVLSPWGEVDLQVWESDASGWQAADPTSRSSAVLP